MSTRTVVDETLLAWPEPETLGDELPPVSSLDLDCLPPSFRPLVKDVSERMQTPPDFAAATAIGALAGCVSRRVIVEPKAKDASWRKPCNLWGGLIGRPGLMKSPLIDAVARPLFKIEEMWRTEYESELSDYKLETEKAELRMQAWRETFKREAKKNKPEPTRPDTSIKEPTQRRLVLQNATYEKLHEILSQNPAGVMVLRDELTGWLCELDREGRNGERPFFLEAWNGTTGYSMERIGRGSVWVPACCVSLFGGIQPARLRTYLQDALQDGPADDGLIQRFQILVWPDEPKEWKLIDRMPNAEAEAKAWLVFERLAAISADEPRLMKFCPDAQALFDDWLTELETTKLRTNTLHPAMIAHLAKYRSLMPVLAALFEVADWAADLGGGEEISLDHARQSADYCEYLESHARRVYSCVVSPEMRAARELARHISAGEFGKESLTVRTAYRHHWSGLSTPSEVRAAAEILEDAGWLRPMSTEESVGRPAEAYCINPKVVKNDG
jgi:hypothetical protein